ncbi:MAG: hypothetical protein LBJ08_03690 [Bifidobacteriaceae bacterium]|jgi:plasmid stability protein|nr:hypothetical protein [Bifidobacteriaceae bacterium]
MALKKKLTVNLSDDVLEMLRDLAARNGTSLTDELRKAIADRAYFQKKIDDGNEVALLKDDQVTLMDLR